MIIYESARGWLYRLVILPLFIFLAVMTNTIWWCAKYMVKTCLTEERFISFVICYAMIINLYMPYACLELAMQISVPNSTLHATMQCIEDSRIQFLLPSQLQALLSSTLTHWPSTTFSHPIMTPTTRHAALLTAQTTPSLCPNTARSNR